MILITGGAGFIGSVLAKQLNQLGHTDLVIVDKLEDSIKWKNLRGIKYLEYIHADELFGGDYDDLIAETDLIFHMGACSATTEKNMDFLMKNNVAYTQALWRFAATKNIPFIYASSAATYGDGELGYSDDHGMIPKLMPLNPYGYSKQLVDEWVLKEEQKPDHWFGLKFFNVYGPNEYHKDDMKSLVCKAHEQIKSNGKVKLFKSHRPDFKDGEQLRDFIYVKDVVRAMIELADPDKAEFSGIYNLGAGKARSFHDLVKATFSAMNVPANIEFIDMPESIRNQYQYYTQADTTKLMKAIPEFQFTSLEDGVRDYVQNYLMKANPHC
ncbi:ADP-glyceromanno-heptose 6-epimerase [Bacteriovorax stolpii]|uniref:ADP-L-glycero-D-manno-heptose-6-epimerase n=1 Tax=Bacteriovorax stolpii TaxID=960 RepID=A0A2K9NTA4_BACTC|nr:ADP-glyceromanno-heptose 6-epimerase [Bacteriovorax stolpii]AUN98756.1 ADP-glyceromanno-heptose 6-epimerase [Bacteriovorax stolpii]QDK41264.1 ADP-glyceromanno-heptose 6-epimerase [Bacteriovorax stolpii]TDP55727.1 ADP-L-glycero-D-manno-heptose 6-epimerase [Bacteriovorax stolpii]BDT28900.1 ADP-glyceromanno-heptose 6-epimerase [Bacteriovorax sp. HI3]